LENVFTECLNENNAILPFLVCGDKITILSVVRLQILIRKEIAMNQRTERLLENWLANTTRHCRATRLFNLNIHHLNRDEQVGLANACLDYFESEAERLLKKKSGGTAGPHSPPSPKGGKGGGASWSRSGSGLGR
jgi:hypothetical protein